MTSLSLQHFLNLGRALKRDESVLLRAAAIINRIRARHQHRAVIFTLAHLAILARVPYLQMRGWIGRRGTEPYREFFVAKKKTRRTKPGLPASIRGKRRIAVPHPLLMRVQRWILHRVLHTATAHEASAAFHKGADLIETARLHCRCRWLIKMDIENFFESIYEPAVFRVFNGLGYSRLLAFELTRLCTRVVPNDADAQIAKRTSRYLGRGHKAYAYEPEFASQWRDFDDNGPGLADAAIDLRDEAGGDSISKGQTPVAGRSKMQLGSLPQGAPTSPLLANLAVRDLDEQIQAIASKHGLVYSRYADDIALSTRRIDFTRVEAESVVAQVLRQFEKAGLTPNLAKTRLVSPGAAKVVLGLTVCGPQPGLTRVC